MTYIIDTNAKRRLSARLAAAIAVSAMLTLGTFAGSASAEPTAGGYGTYHYYNGGYYQAPPVVYGSPYGGAYYGSPYYNGSPYYYAPPVVYGPSVGISLPFIGIGIR
jgi:hypothetical protein